MVTGSAMMSELAFHAAQQVGVRLGIDLAPQNLLRAGNGERRDLAAQHFLCPRDLLLDLGFRPRYKPFALGPRRILCFFDDFHRALFCLRKNILCLLSCVAQQLGCPLGGLFEILLAAFSGRQALGDLLLTLLDRAQERRLRLRGVRGARRERGAR